MSILKYIDRARRMDDLIRRKATGSAEEFARRLGVSRRILMENLNDLKELGAPICYDDCCKSYYYKNEFSLFFHNKDALNKIRGGRDYFLTSAVSPHYGYSYLINISGQK